MEDPEMNTDVQRNHKIVVGAGVALIAVAGISMLAVNVQHVVPTKSAVSTAPAALPDTSAPQANQTPETAPPPPLAEGPPISGSATGAAATAAPPASSPPLSRAASQSTTKVPSLAATHQRVEPAAKLPAVSNAPSNKVAEVTAMARAPAHSNATEASKAQPADSAAAGSGMLVGSSAGTADAAPGAVDSNSTASAATAPSASDAPAVSGGEVTTTMQARAAGGDSANADRMITSAVQSQIASDVADQGAALKVTTINGVVILTGTVPTVDAVEHVKQVVQQIKDVKGVDATAVRVASS